MDEFNREKPQLWTPPRGSDFKKSLRRLARARLKAKLKKALERALAWPGEHGEDE